MPFVSPLLIVINFSDDFFLKFFRHSLSPFQHLISYGLKYNPSFDTFNGTIPSIIKEALTNNGFVEIKINNLAELCISAAEEVEKPIKFDAITNFSSSKQLITHRIVTIKDEIFSYRVVYKYNTQQSDNNIKVVTYSDIMGMPSDVIAKLKLDGVCTLNLENND